MLKNKKLAVIGVGKLGEALISGLLKKEAINAEDVCGTVGHEPSLQRVKDRLNIEVMLDNQKLSKTKTSYCLR